MVQHAILLRRWIWVTGHLLFHHKGKLRRSNELWNLSIFVLFVFFEPQNSSFFRSVEKLRPRWVPRVTRRAGTNSLATPEQKIILTTFCAELQICHEGSVNEAHHSLNGGLHSHEWKPLVPTHSPLLEFWSFTKVCLSVVNEVLLQFSHQQLSVFAEPRFPSCWMVGFIHLNGGHCAPSACCSVVTKSFAEIPPVPPPRTNRDWHSSGDASFMTNLDFVHWFSSGTWRSRRVSRQPRLPR